MTLDTFNQLPLSKRIDTTISILNTTTLRQGKKAFYNPVDDTFCAMGVLAFTLGVIPEHGDRADLGYWGDIPVTTYCERLNDRGKTFIEIATQLHDIRPHIRETRYA